jgi:hypothetical protein
MLILLPPGRPTQIRLMVQKKGTDVHIYNHYHEFF